MAADVISLCDERALREAEQELIDAMRLTGREHLLAALQRADERTRENFNLIDALVQAKPKPAEE